MANRGSDARQDIDNPLEGALRGMNRQHRKAQAAARVAIIEAQRAVNGAPTAVQRITDLEDQVQSLRAALGALQARLDAVEANTHTGTDEG